MSTNNELGTAKAASTASFITALVLNLAVFGGELTAFTILRPYFKLIYEPRSMLPVESLRQAELSSNIFLWPLAVMRADYTKIRQVNGMDAYFFVRYLRMILRIFLPIWPLTWLILLPVTAVNTHVPGNSGLDLLAIGNISPDKQGRYWAHLSLAWVFTFWVARNIRAEMHHFVQSRQHHLTDKAHSSSAQASTVLITGIPSKYLTESAITDLFSYLPGGVKKVWLNRNLGDLPKVYKQNLKARKKLESAETKLINTAIKLRNQQTKAALKEDKGRKLHRLPPTPDTAIDTERQLELAETLVPLSARPTKRLPPFTWLPFSLPLMGEKVDAIEWAREEIGRTNALLETGRHQWRVDVASDSDNSEDTFKPLNSAFVLFHRQIAAHLAAQSLTHHDPYRMAEKHIEVAPRDVIWSNLGLNPYETKVRLAISYLLTLGLIVLWTFPVAFIGAVSNVTALCQQYHWLAWLCHLPKPVQGVIQGILPPVALAVLMLLLPIVLRLLARFEGIPSRTGVELSLMTRYFCFLVIHSFLVVTLSSGIIAALPGLVNNPASIPTLLAQNLPAASNFFLTYVILQGLSGSAAGFLQIVNLVLYYVKLFLLGSTPRQVFNIKYGPQTVAWGTLFPAITLLVVIAMAYSIIAPIINGLICVSFFLFFMLYKYLFLWIMQMPASGDTGGLFFPKAIQHLFVGMYIQQICLAALFFLARDQNKKASAIPEGALMLVLLAFTAFYHIIINNSYGPLINFLPLTLADKTYGLRRATDEPAAALEPTPAGDALLAANTKAPPTVPGAPVGGVTGLTMTAEPVPTASGADTTAGTARRRTGRDTEAGAGEDDDGNISEQGTAPSVAHEFATGEPRTTVEDEGPTDFTHPAISDRDHIVWLPRDPLGLGEAEQTAIRARGIEATCAGADMDEKGRVTITTAPPDQDLTVWLA